MHKCNRICNVFSSDKTEVLYKNNISIAEVLYELAQQFPDSILVWCEESQQDQLNLEQINSYFQHSRMMISYNPFENGFVSKKIGYVEDSPFISINRKVKYPTWQMSSIVGAIHGSVILDFKPTKCDFDFDYYINSVAKLGMPLGLWCYSAPKILNGFNISQLKPSSDYKLFKFVKQHYKTRWSFLLFLNLIIYERRFLILPLLCCFFYKKRKKEAFSLDFHQLDLRLEVMPKTIDVIIPTIGRKKPLYDFLKDLSQQTHLPKRVIIVEQNQVENSISELDYLETENWPFEIHHRFINQSGACNARNIAMASIKSSWVFLADDDIRVENNFIFETFSQIEKIGADAVTLRCHLKNEKKIFSNIFQWNSFGSGCSFVKYENLKTLKFNLDYEFGFGEDTDFGMQLRNSGCDILYLPEPSILHLKAAIGGFRTKPILRWQTEKIQPKPSPTIMIYMLKHFTKEQLLGYKTILFFKYFKHQSIKNPIFYYKFFKKQWTQSQFWANEILSSDGKVV